MASTYSLKGVDKLLKRLAEMEGVDLSEVVNQSLESIYDRAGTSAYTPTDTGNLKESSYIEKAESRRAGFVGYTADYAAAVEFGHRTRDGGFVSGQYFLKENIELEEKLIKERFLKAIREGD